MKNITNKFFLYKTDILNLILSFFAVYGIIGMYGINNANQNLSNFFINIIIFIAIFMLYKQKKELKKGENIFSLIFALFLSMILIIGAQLEIYSDIIWSSVTILKIMCLSIAIYPVINLLINFINICKVENIGELDYKKLSLITFFIIIIFNFLVFLAIYPGEYAYDAGFQIMEILEPDVSLTSHFSLLYSFILAKIVNLGNIWFGSYQVGLAIYSILQMIFMSYVSTKITIFSTKKTKNMFIYLLSAIFFSIFPLYTIMVLSTAQDTIFAGIFALLVLNLIDLVSDESYWDKKRNPIFLSILTLLLCLMRNNGFYAILVSLPFIMIFNKNKRIFTLTLLLVPLILFKIYTGPILDYMNVVKGDAINEMSSIPSQQIARVYNYNQKAFTEEDLNELNKYYTRVEDFKYYMWRQSISDYAKSVLDSKYVSNNLTEYGKFWIKIGLRDPKNYIEAFLLHTLGFWYPNKDYNDDRMYHPYIEYEMMDGKKWNEKYVNIERESKNPLYDKVLSKILVDNSWKEIPVISTIFTTGTYFIIYVFLIGFTIINKKFKLLAPFSLIGGLYVTLFLSPVALFRYCFPIVILLPLLVSYVFYNRTEEI